MVAVYPEPEAELATCPSRDWCDDPYRAGTHIYVPVSLGNTVECTAGFMARKASGAVSNEWYMLTAGHCISGAGGNGVSWRHNGAAFGKAYSYTFGSGGSADAGVIKMSAIDYPTNYVFGDLTTNTITSSITNANQDVGDPVCLARWATWKFVGGTGYGCGLITAEDTDITVGGITIHHQWRTDVDTTGGDSGSPAFSGHAAMGIVSARLSTTWTSYSTIDWFIATIGYRPCYTQFVNPCP